jgi:LCP family protein required for cell wall assembly
MRRRADRGERLPRVGAAMLARAAVAAVVIVLSSAGAVVAGAFVELKHFTAPPKGATAPIGGINSGDVPLPAPGGPRTILVLGTDRRASTAIDARNGQKLNSDTILIVRLDPQHDRTALLTLPRDLAVTIPGVGPGEKINHAFDVGGAAKTLATVEELFRSAGEHLVVNSVIQVDFRGFRRAVDYVHGVYVDVDRRYYNPAGSGYAAINLEPGYQRLNGQQALAYVRFRHTDSDIFRNARQEDFLREAVRQPAVRRLKSLSRAQDLLNIFRRYFRFDRNFLSTRNIIGLLKTGLYLSAGHAPVNQIRLGNLATAADPVADTRLFASTAQIRRAYRAFMGGAGSVNPHRTSKPKTVHHHGKVTGLVSTAALRNALMSRARRRLCFPVELPKLITPGSTYAAGTPRTYLIDGYRGKRYEAYRLVVDTGQFGLFYGVQGTTWRTPPILEDPDRVLARGGRRLLEFFDGKHLRLVGWRTPTAAYWVTNTLTRSISNSRLLAIAASLRA